MVIGYGKALSPKQQEVQAFVKKYQDQLAPLKEPTYSTFLPAESGDGQYL